MPAPGRDADPYAREREVLDLAEVIRVARRQSGRAGPGPRCRSPRPAAEGSTGRGWVRADADAGCRAAIGRPLEDAKTASFYGWAVLTAALDVARLGAQAPLGIDLLRAAAVGYAPMCSRRRHQRTGSSRPLSMPPASSTAPSPHSALQEASWAESTATSSRIT